MIGLKEVIRFAYICLMYRVLVIGYRVMKDAGRRTEKKNGMLLNELCVTQTWIIFDICLWFNTISTHLLPNPPINV